MQVHRDAGIPLYRQIEEYIRNQIESGAWSPGTQIPTEQMLCEQFRVSRITVVKALSRLANEGWIRKEQGRGTFVTASWMPDPLTLRSFSEEMKERGMRPGTLVIAKSAEVPSARLRELLHLGDGEKVWKFSRLLTADDTPVGIQHAHLPVRLFPDLADHLVDHVSLYRILNNVYGVVLDNAIETYRAVRLHDEECALLSVPPASPAFSVERLTYAAGGPVEFVRSLMRSDYFHYTVRLSRQPYR